jgi:hypothetical protein
MENNRRLTSSGSESNNFKLKRTLKTDCKSNYDCLIVDLIDYMTD